MPYNENGEYVTSIYVKEDLPTWSEIYNDWILKKAFYYDNCLEEHQELDLYWKIPRRKYLLMTVCNQLNKMLFEDNMLQGLTGEISSMDLFKDSITITDARFIIEDSGDEYFTELKRRGWETTADYLKDKFKFISCGDINTAPPIYTLPLPTGKKNPFIISNHKRIESDSFKGILTISLVLSVEYNFVKRFGGTFVIHPEFVRRSNIEEQGIYYTALNFVLKPIIEYFKDEVGWKDKKFNENK